MKKSGLYIGFRYPVEIISHAVWRYFRFLMTLKGLTHQDFLGCVVICKKSTAIFSGPYLFAICPNCFSTACR